MSTLITALVGIAIMFIAMLMALAFSGEIIRFIRVVAAGLQL